MENLKFIQVTPNELVILISESVKTQIQELSNYLKALPPTKNEKEFLTRKEVAELFKVSLVTIHEWCNSGILKHYKVGNRTYFKYTELLETLYNSNRS
jgi:excisionase family DNA binding protein